MKLGWGMAAIVGLVWAHAAADPAWLPMRVAGVATSPQGAQAHDFVVFGDCRNNLDTAARAVAAIIEEAPDFVVATGDYVNDGGVRQEWQAFREVIGPLLAVAPLYPAIGNHDRQGRGRRVDFYRETFPLPPGPQGGRYYKVDHDALRLIVLDSNAYASAAQTEWLTNTLHEGARQRRMMFVAMHHPVYSIALHGGHEKIRETWAPLFEHYGVQAVFAGHDHVYARAEAGGVRYFVTGGAGAPLYGKSRRPNPLDVTAVKHHARVNHYLRVHVLDKLVEVSAVKLDGSLIERVRWEVLPAVGAGGHARTTMSVPGDFVSIARSIATSAALTSTRQGMRAAPPWPAAPSKARLGRPSLIWLLAGLALVVYAALRLARLRH